MYSVHKRNSRRQIIFRSTKKRTNPQHFKPTINLKPSILTYDLWDGITGIECQIMASDNCILLIDGSAEKLRNLQVFLQDKFIIYNTAKLNKEQHTLTIEDKDTPCQVLQLANALVKACKAYKATHEFIKERLTIREIEKTSISKEACAAKEAIFEDLYTQLVKQEVDPEHIEQSPIGIAATNANEILCKFASSKMTKNDIDAFEKNIPQSVSVKTKVSFSVLVAALTTTLIVGTILSGGFLTIPTAVVATGALICWIIAGNEVRKPSFLKLFSPEQPLEKPFENLANAMKKIYPQMQPR